MHKLSFAAALMSAGLLASSVAFGQQTPNKEAQPAQNSQTATKQHTQSDPSGQYNFPTPGGKYSDRPTKQRAEGTDATGLNH